MELNVSIILMLNIKSANIKPRETEEITFYFLSPQFLHCLNQGPSLGRNSTKQMSLCLSTYFSAFKGFASLHHIVLLFIQIYMSPQICNMKRI